MTCELHVPYNKEFFRTCNVLPFSCTHLALVRGKRPQVHTKQKDSRISLPYKANLVTITLHEEPKNVVSETPIDP